MHLSRADFIKNIKEVSRDRTSMILLLKFQITIQAEEREEDTKMNPRTITTKTLTTEAIIAEEDIAEEETTGVEGPIMSRIISPSSTSIRTKITIKNLMEDISIKTWKESTRGTKTTKMEEGIGEEDKDLIMATRVEVGMKDVTEGEEEAVLRMITDLN